MVSKNWRFSNVLTLSLCQTPIHIPLMDHHGPKTSRNHLGKSALQDFEAELNHCARLHARTCIRISSRTGSPRGLASPRSGFTPTSGTETTQRGSVLELASAVTMEVRRTRKKEASVPAVPATWTQTTGLGFSDIVLHVFWGWFCHILCDLCATSVSLAQLLDHLSASSGPTSCHVAHLHWSKLDGD